VIKHENAKHEKCEKRDHQCVKMCKNRGGLISALKPGPVVPPGTQKVPDQAARKTQTVDFGHLSDILAFLGGGQFLMFFLSFFSDFNFITFCVFAFSDFVTFYTFMIFSILVFFCFVEF